MYDIKIICLWNASLVQKCCKKFLNSCKIRNFAKVLPSDGKISSNYNEIVLKISAGSILIEIEESMILAQFFRIEIVKKSILEYLPKSAKIKIE